MMNRRLWYLASALLFLQFSSGCIFSSDSDDKKDNDKGTYTLKIDPLLGIETRTVSVQYFIELQPGEDFAGDVSLSVETAPELHPWFTAKTLTIENPLVELACFPDSTAATDSTYMVSIVATHARTKTTQTEQFTLYHEGSTGTSSKAELDLFVAWLDSTYAPFSQSTDKTWQFCNYGATGSSTFYYSNHSWQITMHTVVYYKPIWSFLLRERGVREPCIGAERNYKVDMTKLTPLTPEETKLLYNTYWDIETTGE
jgi:hypothetical protein